jgi:hypothetical protein
MCRSCICFFGGFGTPGTAGPWTTYTGILSTVKLTDYVSDAEGITDAGLIKLAERCTKLKKIVLPGTQNLGDSSIQALLKNCPMLRHLEITSASHRSNNITAYVFDTLREDPDNVPNLRKLHLDEGNTKYMKAMRAEQGAAKDQY